MAAFDLPRSILEETFSHFRGCGGGRRECQALWLSPWDTPQTITKVVHPKHTAHAAAFVLDDRWLNDFWMSLARENLGIRFQVHTHPGAAFHSPTDDAFPIIHTVGFLSLVIPNFGLGRVGFEDAYLTEIQEDGCWRRISIGERIALI
ncbi:hypothetical protein QO010_002486 [Caulobacter ginsengisoli]|uniref:JAB domain-containing protein n=1 Tax=Caulobacter ginsengisoli TaxID=400775 RepID=A0ABU0IUS7_9CAUL|nr:hypothetical protein [Caulobacter ginsengisoli]MDQ0464702.1 hypothetical protein [Caulobacter ginsengisoli]